MFFFRCDKKEPIWEIIQGKKEDFFISEKWIRLNGNISPEDESNQVKKIFGI